ncbi:DMT family transporter [Marinilabiliaceae bacterium JC017]|nr:DMT family transporter [Marinilabiliaceae bacterium JC017]
MKMRQFLSSTVFLAIISCVLWSTAFVGIKIGLTYTTPIQFAGIRFFLSGLMLVPLCGSITRFFSEGKQHIGTILKVSFLQTFILYTFFYLGISLIPGALTAIIIGSQPLFAAIVAHLFMDNDKMSVRKFLTISFGISGIVLIAIKKGFQGSGSYYEIGGMLLLILANIASGLGNIVVSKRKGTISPLILNAWQMSLGGLSLFLVSLFIEPFNGFNFPAAYYGALSWLSFLSAAAFSIWFMLLQKPGVKVSDLNIWKFIIPVFGALLSWIILPDESPDFYSLSGMTIIGISVILYTKQNRRASKSAR